MVEIAVALINALGNMNRRLLRISYSLLACRPPFQVFFVGVVDNAAFPDHVHYKSVERRKRERRAGNGVLNNAFSQIDFQRVALVYRLANPWNGDRQ